MIELQSWYVFHAPFVQELSSDWASRSTAPPRHLITKPPDLFRPDNGLPIAPNLAFTARASFDYPSDPTQSGNGPNIHLHHAG